MVEAFPTPAQYDLVLDNLAKVAARAAANPTHPGPWLTEGTWLPDEMAPFEVFEFQHRVPAQAHPDRFDTLYDRYPPEDPDRRSEYHQLTSAGNYLTPIIRGTKVSRATPTAVARAMAPYAPNVASLAKTVEVVVDWLDRERRSPQQQLDRAMGGIMLRGIGLAPESFEAGSPLLTQLRRISPGHRQHDLMTQSLDTFFGSFVAPSQESVTAAQKEVIERTPMSTVMPAIEALEAASLHGNGFWHYYGIMHGGVFERPEVLELVHNRLADHALLMGEIRPEDQHALLTAYVKQLFSSYAQADPEHRNLELVGRINRSLANTKRIDYALAALVKEANAITRTFNAQAGTYGMTPLDLLIESPSLLGIQAGEAVRRIQRFTRRGSAGRRVVEAMGQTDELHASNIERIAEHFSWRNGSA